MSGIVFYSLSRLCVYSIKHYTMTIKSLDYGLLCDCLQPGCLYCDQDGFWTKEKEGFFIKALEEITGAKAVYMRTPTYAYRVDYFTVTREGNLTFDDMADSEEIECVLEEFVSNTPCLILVLVFFFIIYLHFVLSVLNIYYEDDELL